MTEQDAEPFFAEEPPEGSSPAAMPWKILVVDDDPGIHAVTRLALADMQFDGRPLEILGVHTGAEAVATMRAQPDIALIFMDVVMESEHAGLEAIDTIRNELGNVRTRIVLRTGQPGQAPEEGLAGRHGINDYSEKTELTATRLKTLMQARLRDYSIMSLHDPLTGLFSRSFLEESLQVEAARFAGTGYPFAVLLFALDRSADPSEAAQQAPGDGVLKAFADLLRRQALTGGIACRRGGEEFVVLMPATAADVALRGAESIRRKWEVASAAHEAAQAPLTVSAGIAIFPQHAGTPEVLLRVAGQAVQRARRKGGNRCEVAAAAEQRI